MQHDELCPHFHNHNRIDAKNTIWLKNFTEVLEITSVCDNKVYSINFEYP